MHSSQGIGSRISRLSAVLGVVAAAAAIGGAWTVANRALEPAASSVFSVRAVAGSLEVRPLCADLLIWDLPAGEVVPATCDRELEPGDKTDALKEKCGLEQGEVTVTMVAGAAARIETKPDLEVAFAIEPLNACGAQPRDAVRVSVGDNTLDADAKGYFYRATPKGARKDTTDATATGAAEDGASTASVATPVELAYLALPLKGQIIVGEEMQFGAGWTAEPSTVLSSATLIARTGTAPDDEVTILEQDVEPGTIIDTHSRWSEELKKGSLGPDAANKIPSATGFVQVQSGSLGVQIYQPLALGLRRYDLALPRVITVSRWQAALKSPQFQVIVSVSGACAGVLGLLFAFFQALDPMRKYVLGSPAADDPPAARQGKAADDLPAATSTTAANKSTPAHPPSTPSEAKSP